MSAAQRRDAPRSRHSYSSSSSAIGLPIAHDVNEHLNGLDRVLSSEFAKGPTTLGRLPGLPETPFRNGRPRDPDLAVRPLFSAIPSSRHR